MAVQIFEFPDQWRVGATSSVSVEPNLSQWIHLKSWLLNPCIDQRCGGRNTYCSGVRTFTFSLFLCRYYHYNDIVVIIYYHHYLFIIFFIFERSMALFWATIVLVAKHYVDRSVSKLWKFKDSPNCFFGGVGTNS